MRTRKGGDDMHESPAVTGAWLGFCEGVSKGEVDRFDDLVSHEANTIIGTAPGEIVTDRAAMRFGFETEGAPLESRSARGFEEG
jgi:hypothetical protein